MGRLDVAKQPLRMPLLMSVEFRCWPWPHQRLSLASLVSEGSLHSALVNFCLLNGVVVPGGTRNAAGMTTITMLLAGVVASQRSLADATPYVAVGSVLS